MPVFKNKHLIIALLVAPLLAIISWFAVDYMVAERPQAAKSGGYYPLVAKSNCRYQSGACTLKNGDIELNFMAKRINDSTVELTLQTHNPATEVLVSFSEADESPTPLMMSTDLDNADRWHAKIPVGNTENSAFRIAASIGSAGYYAETSALFVDYETSFSRENIRTQ